MRRNREKLLFLSPGLLLLLVVFRFLWVSTQSSCGYEQAVLRRVRQHLSENPLLPLQDTRSEEIRRLAGFVQSLPKSESVVFWRNDDMVWMALPTGSQYILIRRIRGDLSWAPERVGSDEPLVSRVYRDQRVIPLH
jgi:hypothetical protein